MIKKSNFSTVSNRILSMQFKIWYMRWLFCLLLVGMAACSHGIKFERSEVHEIRKAQIYLQKTLLRYERGWEDKYTLYLAVRNYADRLGYLEEEALRQME